MVFKTIIDLTLSCICEKKTSSSRSGYNCKLVQRTNEQRDLLVCPLREFVKKKTT